MRLIALFATSIVSGFCLMALEIVGARLLYPSFGSSVDVWAAVISVFILSLSVGQLVGGWLADRTRTNLALGWVVVIAGVVFCTLPIYALRVSETLGHEMDGARFGALAGALVLFFAPSVLLGMTLPMMVKLVFTSAHRLGRTIGTLYAIGSVGNVCGILVTDYLLLGHLPLNTNLIGMGGVLLLVGLGHVAYRIDAPRTDGPA